MKNENDCKTLQNVAPDSQMRCSFLTLLLTAGEHCVRQKNCSVQFHHRCAVFLVGYPLGVPVSYRIPET